MGNFKAFNLKEEVIKAVSSFGYTSPSWIQEKVLPKALKGENIVAQSETGSGKTHSFLIPIMNKINTNERTLQAIIFCPTRELARQTWEFAKAFEPFLNGLKVTLLTSGTDKTKDLNKLSINPHIIIGTPGRIKDIINSCALKVNDVNTIVLDEADMLLELGYMDDIDQIVKSCRDPQMMVFSATLKENLKYKLTKYIAADEQIINEDVQSARSVTHYAIDYKHNDLFEAVEKFLKAKNPYSIIIFCSKVESVKALYAYLRQHHRNCGALYGELSPRERKSMLRRFKNDEFPILVSSDVGARGIDVSDVTEVLSIDLPMEMDYYFHRAGRTGRFGKSGDSYVLYNVDTVDKVNRLINLGIKFNFLKFNAEQLVEAKSIAEKKQSNKKIDSELQREINKAKAQTRSNEVKPGYKKKRKLAVEKAKKQYKRKVIQKDIRRQRVERYKKEANGYGE